MVENLLPTIYPESLYLHLRSDIPSPGGFKKFVWLPRLKIGGRVEECEEGKAAPTSWIFVTLPPVFLLEAHVIFELSFGFAFCHLTFLLIFGL